MKLINKIIDSAFGLMVKRNGRYPESVFFASARTFGEACLELCIFKADNECIKIFLLPRPSDDPFWPEFLHIPGIRKTTRETETQQIKRVCSEVYFNIDISRIRYAASTTVHSERGTEHADIRYIEVSRNVRDDDFYDLYYLPENIIPFQRKIIRLGLEAYLNDKQG